MLKVVKKWMLQFWDPRDFVLKQIPAGGVGAEVGTWQGDFSARILKINKPAKLYLIDPWKHVAEYNGAWYGGDQSSQQKMDDIYNSVANRFKKEVQAGQVQLVRNDSTLACADFKNNYFDWVYVDGNHMYEYVKLDLNNFLPKIKKGGYLIADDYGFKGWWDDGVTKAVDEFVKQHSGKIELLEIKKSQAIMKIIA